MQTLTFNIIDNFLSSASLNSVAIKQCQSYRENLQHYGIRFMVLESQRINVRVDYARSDKGNEAWYLSVTEAF